MTTATHHSLPDLVRRIVAENVDELQWGYLDDRPHAVAVLARLRRGAGKEPQQVPDLLGLIDTDALYDAVAEGGRRPGEADLTRAEDAVHVALTLWALHQQSQGTGMHRPDSWKSPTGLGAAVRRLMAEDESGRTAGKEKEKIDDAVLKRFVRAGSAPDLPALSQRLREIVLLLRREGIPLDYSLLAGQLYRWQKSGGRESVRREWGRSFHSYRVPGNPGGAGGAGTGGPAEAASATGVLSDSGLPSDSDTTFKDAS